MEVGREEQILYHFNMFWIDTKRGYFTDWITQKWVKLTGIKVDPKVYPWLKGACGPTHTIGLDFLKEFAESQGFVKNETKSPKGILPSFEKLNSDTFNIQKIDNSVKHFYEKTSKFSIGLRAEWYWLFQPGGWLLSKLFSQRLQQLNIPLSNSEAGEKITNEIQHWINPISDATELILWLRSFEKTGVVTYSGSYSTCYMKSVQSECVKVVFPLPNGRAIVFFRPEVTENGGLRLVSSGLKFGEPGFYFVVEDKQQYSVRYVRTFKESITVHPEENGEILAEHLVSLWGINFLKMYYQMN